MAATKITLRSKDHKKDAKAKEITVVSSQALSILKLPNSQWELSDKAWKFDGKEIKKV